MTNTNETEAAIAQRIEHIENLGFTVVASAREYRVDFTIYDITGWSEGHTKGVYDVPIWPRAGSVSSGDTVDAIEEAEVYLHGEVKWDGCSNWHFDEQDSVMLHGCSKAGIQRFGDVMALCWDWASELCPAWSV